MIMANFDDRRGSDGRFHHVDGAERLRRVTVDRLDRANRALVRLAIRAATRRPGWFEQCENSRREAARSLKVFELIDAEFGSES